MFRPLTGKRKTGNCVKSRKVRQALKLESPEFKQVTTLGRLATVGALLDWAKKFLKNLGSTEAAASSERLLEEVLGLERAFLFLNEKETVSKPLAQRYRVLIQKRQRRIPVAYLLRKAYFWDEVLEVNESCLIPRPETEILVESFIRHSGFTKNCRFTFLDLGCGSGVIGIALARNFPHSKVTFCDISKKALQVTRRNASRYGLLKRSEFICSDWFSYWGKRAKKWDAIVSNPPYVADEDWRKVEPELTHEPEIALRGGKEGLVFYRHIMTEAENFFNPGGVLFFEMGSGQSRKIKAFAVKQGYQNPEIFKDYLKIDRVFMARAPKE